MNISKFTTNQYQSLINNIDAGFIFLASNKEIVHWNHWISRYSEMQIEDYQGKYFTDAFPEIADSRIEEAIDSAIEYGLPSVISNVFCRTPFPLYKPDSSFNSNNENERIQQAVNIARVEIDDVNYCMIEIKDVTSSVNRENNLERQVKERKQVEAALVKSELRHLAIMDTMIDGLILFNTDGNIESYNPAAERIFGHEEIEVIGESIGLLIDEFRFISYSNSTSQLLIAMDMIDNKREFMGIRQEGTLFPVELSISKISVTDDVFYCAIVSDISERKKIDELKQEFIATVSHELRTPLTSIRGSLGLLQGGIIPGIPEKASELIHISYKNCERLLLLINDILDMEKITSGNIDFIYKKFNVGNLIQQSIASNESYAKQFNVNYKIIENATDLIVNVDEHRFQQIMSNLMSNAAKYSPEFSDVEISISSNDDNVNIDIRDYGEGIPDSFQKNLWNKFTQADASNTKKKGGTGLGLAISKSLIESMHGNISFTSKAGEGATFHLSLPRAS